MGYCAAKCISRLACSLAVGLVLFSRATSAQQLEPRAYAPSPIDVNIAGVPYVYQTGSVITDPSLPIQNVDAKVNGAAVFYDRTFSFFGRSASALLTLPYVWAKVTGDVFEQTRTVTRSGLGDMGFRFSTNIFGGPALTAEEFARTPPTATTLGASLNVSIPTGQYDGAKLINIGTNRWAFKPELGLSVPVRKWTFELYTGVWLFTPNDDFFGGHRRTQNAIPVLQGHVGYTFRPGLWLSLDGTWYSGGETTVDGVPGADRQSNARVGATLAVPLGRSQGFKLAWARGATVRFGQNFTTYGLTYQVHWF
jgi:hypothetical protein